MQKERLFLILSVIVLNTVGLSAATDNTESLPAKLSGIVTDIVTGLPAAGLTVTIADKSAITDAEGRYTISGLPDGIDRMEITGNAIIPRSLMVRHTQSTTLDITVKAADFNNAMFWASAGGRGKVFRWHTPPKWVIYTHVLDTDPPKEFAPKDRSYLAKIITKELPAISDFFRHPQVELFKGRPNDDPRWTGKQSAAGYILCAPMHKGGGYASWKALGRCFGWAKVRNNYLRAPKVWRHEIAHALGMAHAFDNEKWLPRGVKDPNYEITKLHNGIEMYSGWDKLWLHCVYSGFRPSGNTPPDRDPDTFVYGRDTIGIDPPTNQ